MFRYEETSGEEFKEVIWVATPQLKRISRREGKKKDEKPGASEKDS